MSLNVTYALLAAEIVVFLFCYVQDRKPINPAKPKLLPYRMIMLVLMVMFLATLAHIISMLTGQPVKPRSKFGM
jgi:hypothetical protein